MQFELRLILEDLITIKRNSCQRFVNLQLDVYVIIIFRPKI